MKVLLPAPVTPIIAMNMSVSRAFCPSRNADRSTSVGGFGCARFEAGCLPEVDSAKDANESADLSLLITLEESSNKYLGP